ncbi:MAG: 3-hydroxyacyl-CoA dehydrogenase NAD-binding domain-containing protein [Alphaproteobacteria bacterium]
MIRYEVDPQGIATLAWDVPGRSMNVVNRDSLAAFESAVARALADSSVKGVIVASDKPDFIAGADLEMLLGLREAAEIMAVAEHVKALFNRIETGGKPFVAAINGTALGGGLELALACHRRIAADNPKAEIGLPEVTLGLLPGGGGTQRLPRMIGIEKSLPLLLEGRRLGPREALAQGLVDEVVPGGELMDSARRWLMGAPKATKPWHERGFAAPGPAVQSPKGYEIFLAGNALLHARTRGNYPAPQAIMSCVYEGMQVPIGTAFRIESRYFTRLLLGKEARAMIRTLFFSIGDARKLGRRPKGPPATSFSRVGVLGAGMMGSGIAHAAASSGLEVVLIDRTRELAERGKAYTGAAYERPIKSGRATESERDLALARIEATTDFQRLAGADLVVEAVFEDVAIKADVTGKAEAALGPESVFASNTSTLPISSLARASRRPDSFIGLHFFSPVDRMQLVEVIRGKRTSEACLAKALDFVKRIGKVPILVNDSRGFYTSRIVATYLEEGMAMLAEGVEPALIENAGRIAGFPVGPLALTDEVSLELARAIRLQQKQAEGNRYKPYPGDDVLEVMVAKLGRKGRKSGTGFYDYPKDGKKRLWPGLAEQFPRAERQPNVEEAKTRLLYVQSVDSARCLEEGVLTDPRDGDVGSVLGWAFPPHTGGALSFIDMVGVGPFVAECKRLARVHGPRFRPPRLLRDLAEKGGSLYPSA